MTEFSSLEKQVHKIISDYDQSGKFTSKMLLIDEDLAKKFVMFRANPVRFLPRNFDGDWARPDKHPSPGEVRLLRVMRGHDKVIRVIVRQERGLFAYPWL